jgi:hypothetical protein
MILPKSLLFERHRWLGFSFGSDLFDHCAVLGFVTVYASKQSMADRLRDLRDALEILRHQPHEAPTSTKGTAGTKEGGAA